MVDRFYAYFNELNGVIVRFGANGKVSAISKLARDSRIMGTAGMRQVPIKLLVDGVAYDIDRDATLRDVGVTPGM